jgi:hypothetical protein
MPPRIDVLHSARFLIALILVLNAVALHAAAPEVASVSPSRGSTAGGTSVTIKGTGFTGATEVVFGGAAASSFVIQNDTTITADAPAGAVGLVDVTVSTPEGSSTLQEGFGYGTLPTAVADVYAVAFNSDLSINSPGVLLNDDASGGGGVVVELSENVKNGTLTLTADGGFTYTPSAGFVGTDRFVYRSLNNTGFSNHAVVTINVAAPPIPFPPTGLYASEIRANRVTLRWTPPVIGKVPTGFVVEGGVTPNVVLQTIAITTDPIVTFEAPTGAFYVRVRTRSGLELSEPSSALQIFVNLPIPPAAPEHLIALVNGSTLTLAWRNSYAGGEPARLVLDVSGSAEASLLLGLADRVTFAGVPAGTYTLSLRALNSAGSSFPSTPVTIAVPDPCSGAPQAPTNFLAYKVGSTIHVVWDAPTSGPAPTGYVLNVTGSFFGSFPTLGREMSGTVGPGSYSITVVAINPCGPSAATVAQTVTIP